MEQQRVYRWNDKPVNLTLEELEYVHDTFSQQPAKRVSIFDTGFPRTKESKRQMDGTASMPQNDGRAAIVHAFESSTTTENVMELVQLGSCTSSTRVSAIDKPTELVNPEIPRISRRHIRRFLVPADEKRGHRPCLYGASCQAFCIGVSEGDLCSDPTIEKKPLREFLMPDAVSRGGGEPDMCVACMIHSTGVHVAKHLYNRVEPTDILQRFRVAIGPGEFVQGECWPTQIYQVSTGVPYPFPKYSAAKFSWCRAPDPETGEVRPIVVEHFQVGPAA